MRSLKRQELETGSFCREPETLQINLFPQFVEGADVLVMGLSVV